MKNRRCPQNALQRPMVRWSWFFLLPMVSAFAIGFVWPFLQGIYLSFCEFRLISDAKWVGLKNYISVFQDTNFMRSFGYTAVFAVAEQHYSQQLKCGSNLSAHRGVNGEAKGGLYIQWNIIHP